jgi:hypothetical protein
MQQNNSYKIILGDNKDTSKINELPNQRVSRKKKQSKEWQESTIDYFINSIYNYDSKRKTPEQIKENWDFYNAELSSNEIKKHLDPLNVEEGLMKEENISFGFYDILHQPFDTLIGEELKRISEIKAYGINSTVINEKDKLFKDKVSQYFVELVQSKNINEKEIQNKLAEFDNYKKRDLQSSHEQMANQILEIFTSSQLINSKYKFNQGFKNLEIVGDAIYRIYNIGNEPNFELVNSDNFIVLGMGKSNWIQDGYAWIEIDYLNPNKIIEEFADELTDKEIDEIFKGLNNEVPFIVPNQIYSANVSFSDVAQPITIDGNFLTDDGSVMNYPLTENGNIRIYRVQWLSLRKFGKLTYYDEFGDKQQKWVDEYYPINIEKGEEVAWIWGNELWEGVKIGDNIYKKVRPCPIQMRSLINPLIVKPSYVGYVNADNNKCVSRIDRLKDYQRMYNIFVNKLITLWTQNIGKVGVVDVSRIPSDMSTDSWYLWLKRYKLMFENSFEEGKKGAAKGLIAGNMQKSAGTIDLSLAEEINNTIIALNWIESRVNKIAAVPDPRQGNMTGREGLGVSQQAVSQSTHQTEFDYFVHDILKSLTAEIWLEYSKYLWQDEKEKRQFLLDDLSNHIIDIDGAILAEGEYGIKITNSSKLFEMFNTIKQLTHAAMQTGTATLSDVARMFMSNSPSEMLEQLEIAEEKRIKQQSEQANINQQTEQAKMQTQIEFLKLQHQFDLEKMDKEWQYKLQSETLKVVDKMEEHSTDNNQNKIEDEVELEMERIKAENAIKLAEKNNTSKKEIEEMKLKSAKEIEKIRQNSKKKSL